MRKPHYGIYFALRKGSWTHMPEEGDFTTSEAADRRVKALEREQRNLEQEYRDNDKLLPDELDRVYTYEHMRED